MNVDKNNLIRGLDLVVPKNPRNGWSKEARKIVNDAIEYINNSVSLDEVKQVREEIDDLWRYYDNDLYTDNTDSMFKCKEVFEILDRLIESEG